jgi:hypothetical protein
MKFVFPTPLIKTQINYLMTHQGVKIVPSFLFNEISGKLALFLNLKKEFFSNLYYQLFLIFD